MKPEDQRIAIAEACPELLHGGYIMNKMPMRHVSGDHFVAMDFISDLNAMCEAEKTVIRINDELTVEYFNQLSKFVGPYDRSIQASADIFCATAAQRAEAFLRTIGKWKDEFLPNNLQTQQDSPSLHECNPAEATGQ